jgi:hypothetical protein
MKRSILLLGCLAVLGVPGVVQAAAIDPVTLTLDMPNQVVTAPTSGLTTVVFSGSFSIAPGWAAASVTVDFPTNSSQTNSLISVFDPAFIAGYAGGSSYTGNLFDVSVPAGTPPDLYAFKFASSNPSVFSVTAFQTSQANGAVSIDGVSPGIFTGSAPFSVLVNGPATGVPDHGSTLILMGASVAVLGLGRWAVRVS